VIGKASSIALSGLQVASARQARSAHNVANVHTEGFQAQREVATEATPPPGVRSQATPTVHRAPVGYAAGREIIGSNTDLSTETVERISALHAFKANLAVVRSEDEMQQALLGIKA